MTNLDNTELESCEQSADFVEAINMQTDEQLLDSLGTYLSIADQQGYTVRGIDSLFVSLQYFTLNLLILPVTISTSSPCN